MSVSHFPLFSVFLPQSWSYSAYFSYLTFLKNVFPHIPSSIVFLFHFSHFLVFLAIFLVFPGVFLILFSLSILLPYSSSYGVHFSFFTFFSVSCHIPGHTVCVSFSTFFSFFIKIQVLQCVFPIFHVLHCFSLYSRSYTLCYFWPVLQCFSPCFRSYQVSVSFSLFVTFLAIFQVLQCEFIIFLLIIFLAIFQVLEWAFLIFHVFKCF